jgi:hypothetical protein
MKTHNFEYSHETDTDHVFVCSKCGMELGFNKPGVGQPNADLSGDVPAIPEDSDIYVTPCEVQ